MKGYGWVPSGPAKNLEDARPPRGGSRGLSPVRIVHENPDCHEGMTCSQLDHELETQASEYMAALGETRRYKELLKELTRWEPFSEYGRSGECPYCESAAVLPTYEVRPVSGSGYPLVWDHEPSCPWLEALRLVGQP